MLDIASSKSMKLSGAGASVFFFGAFAEDRMKRILREHMFDVGDE